MSTSDAILHKDMILAKNVRITEKAGPKCKKCNVKIRMNDAFFLILRAKIIAQYHRDNHARRSNKGRG